MKRFVLTIVCCCSLLFFPLSAFSLNLTGPNGEESISYVQYGPVSDVETLWGIATIVRPDSSVTIQQTLVAIYKLNPDAFYQGNINKIIPESILEVPSLAFVQQQTAQEAIVLINKYSPAKKVQAKKTAAVKKQPVKAVEKPPVKTPEKKPTEPPADNNSLVNQNKLIALESELKALRKEFVIINEQLLVETESNQVLKVKLQPLYDEIGNLQEQIDNELAVHEQLQKTIDDYRARLDAVKARPFSGEGFFNRILRSITSSLTNLLIAIISPILLLLAAFVVIMRVNAKRILAKQEQELAESTSALMEETGKFDSLLTEDMTDGPEVDFSADESFMHAAEKESEPQASPQPEDELEAIDLTDTAGEEDLPSNDGDPFGISELAEDNSVDLSELEEHQNDDDPFGIASLTEEFDTPADEDDPFGIAALADELPDEIDEDDPFAISALSDEDEHIDLDEEVDQDDPFGISALAEQENLFSESEQNTEQAPSASEQADLDLAAQWEEQLAELPDQEEGIQENEQALEALSTLSEENRVEDVEEEFELPGEDDLQALGVEELIDKDELSAMEADPSIDEALFDELAEAEDETPGEQDKQDPDDILAKQLSDVAFNNDVPLPNVDKSAGNDFIDIDTLLENSDESTSEEPYTELELELELDLGLDDFPDVIDANDDTASEDENEIAAQLDLARAYLEIDDQAGAKEILVAQLEKSSGAQRVEIEKLLSRIG